MRTDSQTCLLTMKGDGVEVIRRHDRNLLNTYVNIPRVAVYQCDNCGHRALNRPRTIHVDTDNYLQIQVRKSRPSVQFQRFYTVILKYGYIIQDMFFIVVLIMFLKSII